MARADIKSTTTRKRKRRAAPRSRPEHHEQLKIDQNPQPSLYEQLKNQSPERMAELQEGQRLLDRAMGREMGFGSRPSTVGRWTLKREMFEAIKQRRFPREIPGTAAVKKQIDADWADECKARKADIPPPVWSSINHWLGRD